MRSSAGVRSEGALRKRLRGQRGIIFMTGETDSVEYLYS